MPTEQEVATAAQRWNDHGEEIPRPVAVAIAHMRRAGDQELFLRLVEGDGRVDRQAAQDADAVLNRLYDDWTDEAVGQHAPITRERRNDLQAGMLELEALKDWIDTHVTLVTCACERADGCARTMPGLEGDRCEECEHADVTLTTCDPASTGHCTRQNDPLCDGNACDLHTPMDDSWVQVIVTDRDETEVIDTWFAPDVAALSHWVEVIGRRWAGQGTAVAMHIAYGTGEPHQNARTLRYRWWDVRGVIHCGDVGGVCDGNRCERHLPGPDGWYEIFVRRDNGWLHSVRLTPDIHGYTEFIHHTAMWAATSSDPVQVTGRFHAHAYGETCVCEPSPALATTLGPGHCVSSPGLCNGTRCGEHLPGLDGYGEVEIIVDHKTEETRIVPDEDAVTSICADIDAMMNDAYSAHTVLRVTWHEHRMHYGETTACACAHNAWDRPPWREWNRPQ